MLKPGQSIYVAEVFYSFHPITPIGSLLHVALPSTFYMRRISKKTMETKLLKFLHRRKSMQKKSGQMGVLFLIMLPVLLGFAGLLIDLEMLIEPGRLFPKQ